MKNKLMSLAVLVSLPVNAFAGNYQGRYQDGDQVSTMGGQLVEVGDRNRYHYGAPTFNLDINPFGVMTGEYSVGGAAAINEHATMRGDLSYYEDGGHWEYSISSQVYFKKLYNGLYLEPGVVRREWDDVMGPQVLLGYTWFWDSGLNISMAAGVGRNLNHDDERFDSEESFGNGYLRVGYAF